MAYLVNYYAIKLVSGLWTIHATSSGVPYIYSTAQAAVDAVKNEVGNNNYKILQEVDVTKTDTA